MGQVLVLFSDEYLRIDVHRHAAWWCVQVYVPSGVVVALSWVSFYINREAAAARISLGLLTILTTTTQVCDTRTRTHTYTHATGEQLQAHTQKQNKLFSQ